MQDMSQVSVVDRESRRTQFVLIKIVNHLQPYSEPLTRITRTFFNNATKPTTIFRDPHEDFLPPVRYQFLRRSMFNDFYWFEWISWCFALQSLQCCSILFGAVQVLSQ
jgi:hypothetical protein